MKPIGKYIVIDEIKEEISTESGILLTSEDTKDLRYKKGLVVVSGTDVDVVNTADQIYYDSRAGYKMVINGTQHTVISESDVVVVL
jgi:co-chaperonin GroES (HSP10)